MSAARRGTAGVIAAGVDGSEGALQAVRWAAAEAARRDAPLLLVYATNAAMLYARASGAPLLDDVEATLEKEAHGALAEAQQVAGRAGVTDVRTRIEPDAPARVLRDVSRSVRMLVLGAAGRGRVGTALGSVTLTVASHAECPVVVVRGESPEAPGPVLVGVDGGPLSDVALAHAFDEASVRGVGLTALHVWNDGDVARAHLDRLFETQPWEQTREVEERALAERLAGWSQRYPDVTVERRIERDEPALALVDASSRYGLVVVATRGRGGFSGLLLGSTGLALIQSAGSPVMLVGPESVTLP